MIGTDAVEIEITEEVGITMMIDLERERDHPMTEKRSPEAKDTSKPNPFVQKNTQEYNDDDVFHPFALPINPGCLK